MIDQQKNNEPLDLSYLKDMCGDNAEFIIEMIDVFKQQTPIYIQELRDALSAGDWAKVAATAHKIKPTFVYIGREDAKELMQQIETNAKEQKDLDRVAADCEEVIAFTELLYQQLDAARIELQKQL